MNDKIPQSAASGDPAKAPVKRLRHLRLIASYVRPYKGLVSVAVIALIIAAGATLAIFKSLELIVDQGFAADDAATIDRYFLGLLVVVVILAIATFFRFYSVTILGERVVADIRAAVHSRVIDLSLAFFEVNRPGEIASRLTADTTLIQTVVGSSASVALRNFLMLVGGIVMLLLISPKLLGLIALVIPLIIVPIVFIGGKVRAYARSSQDRIAAIGVQADEAFGAIQIVQAFTHEDMERRRFRTTVEEAFEEAKKRIHARSWMTALVIVLVFGAIDLVLWRGAKDVIIGTMTGGELASFVGLSILVAGAVGALVEVYGDLQRAAGAAGRLAELLAEEPDIKAPENPVALPAHSTGSVAFDNVTFRYPSKPDIAALENFTLKVEPGKTVALVGPSGAGKTTVLKMLLRFFDPQSGHVLIDGVNVKAADPRHVRSRISLVPQETVIFADTVLENIRYGRPDASDEDVAAAAEAAAAMEFIGGLADGMHTYLGEQGVRLSGGQRQRIAIARAILRDAPILLLDEATSALDAASERLVQSALERLMEHRTTIVIAHRLATVLRADQIVVMEDGGIVASGTHADLMARGGLYAELANLQFQSEAAQ